jgi:hypothetical protein
MPFASELYLGNDFIGSLGPLYEQDRTTSVPALYPGATVRCYFAASDALDAAPIAGLDFALVEEGSTAVYLLNVGGDLTTALLAGFLDNVVWLHFVVNGTGFHAVKDVTVRGVREL